jgi:LacI family transcriptional regulator
MAKTVRMSDIAQKLGVSNVTVSKALADKDGVSAELREKIKKLAQEMGYHQNTAARSLKGGCTFNIGILVPEKFVVLSSHSFYWELYQKLCKALSKREYYGILEVLTKKDEENLVLPRMMLDSKVDGVIVIGQIKSEYIGALLKYDKIPLMFLDSYDKNYNYDVVLSDNFYGMYQLTDYLVKTGHKKIFFVGNYYATSSIQDRFLGYMKGLLDNRIEFEKDWVIFDREIGEAQITFSLPKEIPDAFACNCDEVAHVVIKTLTQNGYKVPEDVSVVGFDHFLSSEAQSQSGTYQITTFDVNMKEMAERAVDVLIKKINHKDIKQSRRTVTGSLIIGNTVKKRK